MRKDGYYWVKFNNEWEIAMWTNNGKNGGEFIRFYGKSYAEWEFDDINENQIKLL